MALRPGATWPAPVPTTRSPWSGGWPPLGCTRASTCSASGPTPPPPRGVARAYEQLCARLAAETPDTTWVSVDLSHLAFDAGLLDAVATAVPPGRRLQIGAEEAAHADRVLDLVVRRRGLRAPRRGDAPGQPPRSTRDADRLAAAGVPVRLVKGAYVEPGALPYGAPSTTRSCLARRLHAHGAGLALATHDRALREHLLPRPAGRPLRACCSAFALSDAAALAAAGRDVRVYVPYGDVLVPLLHAPPRRGAGEPETRPQPAR